MLGGLEERVIQIVEQYGYVGVTLLITLETVFPPIPSEVILPLAGFLSAQGHLTLLGVVLAATLGSVAGALVLYAIGHWLGNERLERFIDRYGHFILVSNGDLAKAHGWFERHSGKAVVVGRLVPAVRSLVSLPAGVTRMPLTSFILLTAIGSAIWNSTLVGLGYVLGSRWREVRGVASYVEYVVILGLLAIIVWFAWSRRDRWRIWLTHRS